jgi:Zn-finger protein
MGDKCGGGFLHLKNGIKDCSKCTFPHVKENYGSIIEKLGQYIEESR